MINTRVHNHGPDEGPGAQCPERVIPGQGGSAPRQLRGECVEADGCDRGAHGNESDRPRRQATCEHALTLTEGGFDGVVPLCPRYHFPDGGEPSCPEPPSAPHRCRKSASIEHTIHVCTCGWGWPDRLEQPSMLEALESKPRRVWLATLLTDLMATIDDELAELAEVRRTEDRVVASDTERVMDYLGQVWSKAAEARTAVRDSDLGYLPLPEVG